MPEILAPQRSTPIVDKSGYMNDEFQRWVLQITRTDLMIGDGSPEGVFEGTIGQEYMDRTPGATPVKYIKQLPDINGYRNKGWVGI